MQDLFKGYVPTKNKKCLTKFKDAPLRSYEEVKDLPEFAGILAENIILIDIDDTAQSEILLTIVKSLNLACRVYQTTRGKHFFFLNRENNEIIQRNCKIHSTLAVGLVADIKVGIKASYSILKYNGKEREIIYDCDELESLPKWLLPVKSDYNFLTMGAGEGRNQSLFTYILKLQSCNFEVEEIRNTLRLINDFILPDPLDESELETLMRDEAFEKPVFFNDQGTFLFGNYARHMRQTKNIIKLNGRLHIYHNGIYIDDNKLIETEMIREIPGLRKSQRMEVLSYLDLLIGEDSREADANFVAFKNGIYDITTKELMPFSPDLIVTNKINYNYNYEAYSEVADMALDKLACEDDLIRDLLEEVIGYTFYRRNELRKAFILIGEKANGKSTYLDMIKTLLGDENTCALDLGELGERFKTAELFHKLANIGDDIADDFISNPAIFKKLVSGDRLNAERKGQDPFDFNNYAKMIFSANNIPRIRDKTGAVLSRLIIVPFKAYFTDQDPDYDPYIKYKLRSEEVMEYLIQVGLDGLDRVLTRQKFTVSEKVQKELDEYEVNNNPILLFFASEPKIVNEATSDVHKKYTEFCVDNGFTPMSRIEFSRQVKSRYNLDIVDKTIKGKKYRVFIDKKGGQYD